MSHRKALLFLILTSLLWSSGGFLIKMVDWNPPAISGMRSAISVVFILLYTRKFRFQLTFVNIAGGIAYALTVILFVLSNKLTTAANAILLQYTAPVWVAMFSGWFLGEKNTRLDIVVILVVILGMMLFFVDELSAGNMVGNVTAILSGLSFAWLVLLLRKQKSGSTIESIILGNIITALFGAFFMFDRMPDINSWIGLMMLGVFQLGLSYILYSTAIKYVTAIEAILIPVIEPLLNPIWVLLLIGEKPGIYAILGGIIILAAITFRSFYTIRKNPLK